MGRWEPDAEGRLIKSAITLFDEQGYDQTTVEQLATAAGLTKRSFFRYFADKREVLFDRSGELDQCWSDGIAAAPAKAGPMRAVLAGLDQVAVLFADRHAFARTRARVVAANPELQERELKKLSALGSSLEQALLARGVDRSTAATTAQAGVLVFQLGFARWVEQDDPLAFAALMTESLNQLRSAIRL